MNQDKHHTLISSSFLPILTIKGRLISTIGNYLSNKANSTLLTHLNTLSSSKQTYSNIDLSSNEINCLLLNSPLDLHSYTNELTHIAVTKLLNNNYTSFYYPFFIFTPVNNNSNIIQCEIKCAYHNININMELLTNEHMNKIELIIHVNTNNNSNNTNNSIQSVTSLQHLHSIIEDNKHIIYDKCYAYFKSKYYNNNNNNNNYSSFVIGLLINNKFTFCYNISLFIAHNVNSISNVVIVSQNVISNYYFYGDDETNIEINLSKQIQIQQQHSKVSDKCCQIENNVSHNEDDNKCMYIRKQSNSVLTESNQSQNSTNHTYDSSNSMMVNMMYQKIQENGENIKILTNSIDILEQQMKSILMKLKNM